MKTKSKEWAEAFKPAVEELLRDYRAGHDREGVTHCPLCEIERTHHRGDDCDICPWLVFEDRGCVGINEEVGFIEYDDDSLPTRIKRLTRWLDKLNEILEVE